MKLKTVKYIIIACCIVMAVFLFICSHTKSTVWGVAALGAAAVGVAVNLIFARCPSCGKPIGRTYGEYCSHCGAKLGLD